MQFLYGAPAPIVKETLMGVFFFYEAANQSPIHRASQYPSPRANPAGNPQVPHHAKAHPELCSVPVILVAMRKRVLGLSPEVPLPDSQGWYPPPKSSEGVCSFSFFGSVGLFPGDCFGRKVEPVATASD